MKEFQKLSKVLIYVVLLVIIAVGLLLVVTKGEKALQIDYYYTAFVLSFLAPLLYVNIGILIPKLLKKGKYIFYLLSLVFLGGFWSYLIINTLPLALNKLFPTYYFISYPSGADFYSIVGVVLITSTLFSITYDWYLKNKKSQQNLSRENSEIATQLSQLKAQINPHFLFNSLNTLYSQAIEKDGNITSSILQLSEILRYVLYETNVKRISIQKEIAFKKLYQLSRSTIRSRSLSKF